MRPCSIPDGKLCNSTCHCNPDRDIEEWLRWKAEACMSVGGLEPTEAVVTEIVNAVGAAARPPRQPWPRVCTLACIILQLAGALQTADVFLEPQPPKPLAMPSTLSCPKSWFCSSDCVSLVLTGAEKGRAAAGDCQRPCRKG